MIEPTAPMLCVWPTAWPRYHDGMKHEANWHKKPMLLFKELGGEGYDALHHRFWPDKRVRGEGWTTWIWWAAPSLPIAHSTRPIFQHIHTFDTPNFLPRNTTPPYNQNVQLLNQRNGNEELNFFLVFKLRFNELAGELLTHYCTWQI